MCSRAPGTVCTWLMAPLHTACLQRSTGLFLIIKAFIGCHFANHAHLCMLYVTEPILQQATAQVARYWLTQTYF